MFYRLARALFWVFFSVVCRWRIRGRENLPGQGPVVVVANHVSLWDPVVLGTALQRQVTFMAKEELFRLPPMGLLMRGLGAFPVRRGASDREAIRTGIKVLQAGGVLGVFPEGGRSPDGSLQEFRGGAALLALRGQAPVVPVALLGTRVFFRRFFLHRITVCIGPPLPVAGKKSEEVRQEMQEAVRHLLEGKEFS